MRYFCILLTLIFCTLSACTPISKGAKEELVRPLNCHNANINGYALRSYRAGFTRRVYMGLSFLIPTYFVSDLIRSPINNPLQVTTERWAVTNGYYDGLLSAKEGMYARRCGVKS